MKTDAALLQEYVEARAEAAFAELVRRHIDLVYSAALRQVGGDAHLARDVAQTVFRDLARKAAMLAGRPNLAGWLYTSAHFAAAKIVRGERRRRIYEQEAHAMHELTASDGNAMRDWERLRPVLDAAMLDLNETDREAVLLRFFGGRSFAEVGAALRLSEDAARKRVERALDKLHGLLARRGIASSAAALAVAMSENAVAAAPVGLGTAVSATVLSGNAAAVATGGTLLAFTMSKLPFGVAAAAAVALLVTAVNQRRGEQRLRAEIAQLQRERESVRTAAVNAERRASDLRAKLAAAIAQDVPQAEIQSASLTASDLDYLDRTYAGLFRRLRLPREKLDELQTMMVERQRGERNVVRFVREKSVQPDNFGYEGLQELYAIWNRPVNARIRALLGDRDYAYFGNYVRTMIYRHPYNTAADLLSATQVPLRDEQIDQLVAWTEEIVKQRYANVELGERPAIPDEVMARAASILSPLQLQKLETVKKSRDANPRIIAMNRAAAEQGLLKLTAQSARDYPSRGATHGPNP